MTAWLTTFLLGAAYFISALPAGVALGLSIPVAAVATAAGYVAITLLMLLLGTPARQWVIQRFHLQTTPDPTKWFWKVWRKGGLPGLGLIAPVTCGPWIAALLALALREPAPKVLLWIFLGMLPWLIGFALAAAWVTSPATTPI
jgi:hypothetical protein